MNAGPVWGPFVFLQVDNGVRLDYVEADHMGGDPEAIQASALRLPGWLN